MSGAIGRTPPEAVKMASSVAATAATLNNSQCDGQQTEKQSYQTGHTAAESSSYGGGGLPPDVKEKLHVRIGLISFLPLVAFIRHTRHTSVLFLSISCASKKGNGGFYQRDCKRSSHRCRPAVRAKQSKGLTASNAHVGKRGGW
jgi:hypothetical protein